VLGDRLGVVIAGGAGGVVIAGKAGGVVIAGGAGRATPAVLAGACRRVAGVGLPAGAAQRRVADEAGEQIDGALGHGAHGLVVLAGQRQQLRQRQAGLQQGRARLDGGEVAGVVGGGLVGAGHQQALALQGLQQGVGHAGALGQLLTGQRLGLLARAGVGGQRAGQRLLGDVELAVEGAADQLQTKALLLEGADALEALDVGVVVDGVAALAGRRRQQPAGLIEADRVDCQATAAGELLDAVSHRRHVTTPRLKRHARWVVTVARARKRKASPRAKRGPTKAATAPTSRHAAARLDTGDDFPETLDDVPARGGAPAEARARPAVTRTRRRSRRRLPRPSRS
jgi:hypothetical protein